VAKAYAPVGITFYIRGENYLILPNAGDMDFHGIKRDEIMIVGPDRERFEIRYTNAGEPELWEKSERTYREILGGVRVVPE
jgi:hypothetical protein